MAKRKRDDFEGSTAALAREALRAGESDGDGGGDDGWPTGESEAPEVDWPDSEPGPAEVAYRPAPASKPAPPPAPEPSPEPDAIETLHAVSGALKKASEAKRREARERAVEQEAAARPAPAEQAGGNDPLAYLRTLSGRKVRIERHGHPKRKFASRVARSFCGYIEPASPEDVESDIEERWGGGIFHCWTLEDRKAGKPPVVVRIESDPVESREHDEDEEEAWAAPVWAPRPFSGTPAYPGAQGAYPGAGTPGAPFSPYAGPGWAAWRRPEPADTTSEDREHEIELERIRATERAAEREREERARAHETALLRQSQDKSEQMLGNLMTLLVSNQGADKERREHEVELARISAREEAERRDREWKERVAQWDRERQDRLDRERSDSGRREEQERAEREKRETERRDVEARAERERKETREWFDRLMRAQEKNNNGADKIVSLFSGVIDAMGKAREVIEGEPDPTASRVRAVQDVVSGVAQQLRPLMGAMAGGQAPAGLPTLPPGYTLQQGPDGQLYAVPTLAPPPALPLRAPAPAPTPFAAPSDGDNAERGVPFTTFAGVPGAPGVPPGAVPVVPLAAEPNALLASLAALLRRLTVAIKANDPPDWSLGRLQDTPIVLEQLANARTPEDVTGALDILRGQASGDVALALDEFLASARTPEGRQWVTDLLAALHGEEDASGGQ